MQILYGVLSAIIGYALGCFNLAYLLGKHKGIDIRAVGSQNAGTSNTMILLGWPSAVLVGICDIGKGFLACFLAQLLFGSPLFGAVGMFFCVLGHVYPLHLNFKGGKGFASYLGALLAFDWRLFLSLCLAVIVFTLVTDYIVSGTFTVIALSPVWLWFAKGYSVGIVLILCSLLVLFKHRINIVRLIKHEEIGLIRAHKHKKY